MTLKSTNENEYESAVGLTTLIGLVLALGVGIFVALVLMPGWLPNIEQSLLGSDPKAYWYLSRSSAFGALGLLWLSMVLGLLITNKMSRLWPGAQATFAIHEYVSLLGMAFALFHALILIGDRFIKYQLVQILMPFASVNYHPVWVGLGQIGLYVWIIVNVSFYVRRQIGSKTWRWIHYASFFTFLIAILHGLTSGSDTSTSWAQWIYWVLGGSFLFLTIYRIIVNQIPQPSLRIARVAQSQTAPQNKGMQ